MSDQYDDVTVYLLYSCNEWKENSSMRLVAATTDKETLYALIGENILDGAMDYHGKTRSEGFQRYHEDYNGSGVNFNVLDYGFVDEVSNEMVSGSNQKPYDRIMELLNKPAEEAAAELAQESGPLKGIPSVRLRLILDRALADYAETLVGEDLYDLLRSRLRMSDDEITKAGFDLQDYYLGEAPDFDLDAGEGDDLDEER